MGKFEFKFPFEPPWEDLKMEMTTESGVKCYIFDSCVVSREEQATINQEIVDLIIRNDRRKFLKQLQEEKNVEASRMVGGS